MLLLKRHDCSKKIIGHGIQQVLPVVNIGTMFTQGKNCHCISSFNRYTQPQGKIRLDNRVILFSNRF